MGVDSKNIGVESELEEAARNLGADAWQGQKEGFGLLRGHALERTQGEPSEGRFDDAPGFMDVGCAAIGEARAFQGCGKRFNRRIEKRFMRGEEKLTRLKSLIAGLHSGTRTEHKPEQFIQQIRILLCKIFPVMLQQQCIDFFRISPLLFHAQERIRFLGRCKRKEVDDDFRFVVLELRL